MGYLSKNRKAGVILSSTIGMLESVHQRLGCDYAPSLFESLRCHANQNAAECVGRDSADESNRILELKKDCDEISYVAEVCSRAMKDAINDLRELEKLAQMTDSAGRSVGFEVCRILREWAKPSGVWSVLEESKMQLLDSRMFRVIQSLRERVRCHLVDFKKFCFISQYKPRLC